MLQRLTKLDAWSERASFCSVLSIAWTVAVSFGPLLSDPASSMAAGPEEVVSSYLNLSYFVYSNAFFLAISMLYILSDYLCSNFGAKTAIEGLTSRFFFFLPTQFFFIIYSAASWLEIIPNSIINCAEANSVNIGAVILFATSACSVPKWWVSLIGFGLFAIIVGLILTNIIYAIVYYHRAKS